jgi:hypothetical protein
VLSFATNAKPSIRVSHSLTCTWRNADTWSQLINCRRLVSALWWLLPRWRRSIWQRPNNSVRSQGTLLLRARSAAWSERCCQRWSSGCNQ